MEKNKHISQQQEIERLFTKVREYRKSENFREVINFCAHFPQLSPYNAWLAQLQMPNAQYLLSETEWRKRYGRTLRTNARPIIILVPFGPITTVFDISDTVAHDLFQSTEDDILAQLAQPYQTRGEIDTKKFQCLMRNLQYSGVSVEEFEAAAGYAAKIEVNHEKRIRVPIRKEQYIEFPNDYLISINSKSDKEIFFASLCHELGHLFCHHLYSRYSTWGVRDLSHKQEEFEAETVAWLISERNGLYNPSENYLAGYTDKDGNIPNISINAILLAVGEIERMMRDTPQEALKHGILYKHSKGFKQQIDLLKNEH